MFLGRSLRVNRSRHRRLFTFFREFRIVGSVCSGKASREHYNLSPMYRTKSAVRFENPHSLSYQPSTFTVWPTDIVSCESKMQLAGLPTMSLETSGASE